MFDCPFWKSQNKEDQDAGYVVDLELANIHLDIVQDIDEAYRYAKQEYKKKASEY